MAEETQNPHQPNASADEALQAEIAQLKQEKADREALIQDLSNQLEEKSNETPSTSPVVKHEKKEYEVTMPVFNIKGKIYKASELSKHKEVVAGLLKIGSPVLKEKVNS